MLANAVPERKECSYSGNQTTDCHKLSQKSIVIDSIDKKAYLSALSLAKYIAITCDSTSMISEAAITGKPIYVAEIQPKRDDYRFKQFRDLFIRLNIIRIFEHKLETWEYEKLDETQKIAEKIKNKL